MDAAEMDPSTDSDSGRVRLLTFDRLPLLAQLGEDAPETAATLAEHAAAATVFENYYLEQAGVAGLLKSADALPGWQVMADQIRAGRAVARVLVIGPQTAIAWPAWLEVQSVDADAVTETKTLPSATLAWLSAADLCWIHVCDNADSKPQELLSAVLRAGDALCSESNDLLILCAVEGVPGPADVSWKSVLWESCVHVPLSVRMSGQDAKRIQAVTCSSDVPYTISRHLAPVSRPTDGLADLTRGMQIADRVIQIRYAGVSAVRTSEFLFACSVQETDGVSDVRSALYAKPEDVWNINDVSAEYQEIAEQLDALCSA